MAEPDRSDEGRDALTPEQAEAELRKRSGKVKEGDVERVLAQRVKIEDEFKAHGPLGRFIEDVRIMLSLIQDYWNGSYRQAPWFTITAMVAAFIYVLSPVDLIPDFIPVLGYVDDAMVVAACLKLVEQDLHNYKDWKSKTPP